MANEEWLLKCETVRHRESKIKSSALCGKSVKKKKKYPEEKRGSKNTTMKHRDVRTGRRKHDNWKERKRERERERE